MHKNAFAQILPPVAAIVLFSQVVNAATTRVISTEEARGVTGHVTTLTVWLGPGLNINFAPSNETIQKVWLDDISRIGLDTDSPLCDGQNECQGGASIVHLKRRSSAINFPGSPQTSTTLLSVVTQGPHGKKHLNQFMLVYGSGSPQYTSVTVAPTPREEAPPRTILPPTYLLPSRPLPQNVPLLHSTGPTPIRHQVATKRHESHVSLAPALVPTTKPPLNLPPPSTPRPEPLQAEIHHIQTGIARAKHQGLISRKRGNLYLASEVDRYVSYRRDGLSPKEAARKAGLPLYVLQTFENIGN